MRKSLRGIYIPAVTPFHEDQTLGRDMLEFNIRKWNETRISGYLCLGSNGEFRMLDEEESLEVIRTFAALRGKDKGLIAGAGRESLYHTLRFLDRIAQEELDIDGVAILTPHYFRKQMDDRALVRYYTEAANHSRYPVLLYCAPVFANTICVSCSALKELADHPNIIGIKDTSPDMMEGYMETAGGRRDFSVLSGTFSALPVCLRLGGQGGVLSAANYLPNECEQLLTIWHQEGEEMFAKAYSELQARIQTMGGSKGVAGVKACMNALGYQGGIPRIPLLPAD